MSNSYTQEYKQKLKTPEDAVTVVRSGDWIDYAYFNGKPIALDKALAARKGELKDVVVVGAVTLLPVPEVVMQDPKGEVFTYVDMHFSLISRMMQDQRPNVFYNPTLFGEGETYYEMVTPDSPIYDPGKIGSPKRDVFMVRVAPMDAGGYFNWGIHNSVAYAQAMSAKTVIVEVNSNVPNALGGECERIHISQVDIIVESENEPMMELPAAEPTEVDKKIAGHVLGYLSDGCSIQLGIGTMPNILGKMIAASDLKDLSGHTEMLVDAFMDMYESGRMTGKYKSPNKGKIVYTFALGSKALYDWIDNNPALASYNVKNANHPRLLMDIDKLVSINQCVEVDLYSQVSAESSGFKQISGNGGMWDYVTGAFWSKGGRSFICLPSTHKNKEGKLVSRIVPTFRPGTISTIPRPMAHFIVTEYGAVCLKGEPTWRRAEKLISIAHPDFRDELIKAAEKQKIWRQSNKKD